ncbi:hypothetical protein SLA2020_077180 [Shorea laevis]
MGSCVSVEKSSEASDMKVRLPFGSKTENLTIPPSPVKEKQANGDLPVISQLPPSTVKDFGSKEETFFDSKAWLDSDTEDDFYSVNGDFTPSRGSTPVHHSFSRGMTPVHHALADGTPTPIPEPSPTGAKKKLLELFQESLREDLDVDEQRTVSKQSITHGKLEVKSTILDLPPKSANGTPFGGANSVGSSERTANGDDIIMDKEKPIRASPCCLPSLVSCRSLAERKKKLNNVITVNDKV